MIHQTGYWHKEYAEQHHIHSPNVSKWICEFLSNKKDRQIYDFGCGMGNYLNDLYSVGFTKLMGIEVEPPKNDYNFEIISQNLTEPFILNEKGTIISLEVGEHLPKEYMDIFLTNLYENCSDYLIVSWAVRNQGGYGHFNELNNDEIIPLIENKGFIINRFLSQEIRQVPENYCQYFKNTLMIFEKK